MLSPPDPSLQFVVEVDTSATGVGAVLSQSSSVDQKVHPCAFFACSNGDIGWREQGTRFWYGQTIRIYFTFVLPKVKFLPGSVDPVSGEITFYPDQPTWPTKH